MKYHLRAADKADFDFLYRLKVVCLKEYVAAIWGWDEAFQRKHFATHFDPAASHIIVAHGRDIGQLSVKKQPEALYLNGIYLLPAYQQQGLGGQIIRDILSRAQACGRPVRLQVIIGNPAVHLYERLGFRVIDKSDTHLLMRNG